MNDLINFLLLFLEGFLGDLSVFISSLLGNQRSGSGNVCLSLYTKVTVRRVSLPLIGVRGRCSRYRRDGRKDQRMKNSQSFTRQCKRQMQRVSQRTVSLLLEGDKRCRGYITRGQIDGPWEYIQKRWRVGNRVRRTVRRDMNSTVRRTEGNGCRGSTKENWEWWHQA